jgi:hypothetical protein
MTGNQPHDKESMPFLDSSDSLPDDIIGPVIAPPTGSWVCMSAHDL